MEKAYTLLVNESNPTKEKGYVAALYSNIKKCIADKHIHLQTKVDFIDSLMKRAEPELNGRYVYCNSTAVLVNLFVTRVFYFFQQQF